MRLLLLPSEWNHNGEALPGIFVRAQVRALQAHVVQCDVLFVEPRRLRTFRPSNVLDSHFQLERSCDEGIPTYRVRGWNLLLTTRLGAAAYSAITYRTALRYLEQAGPPDLVHAHNALLAGTIARKLRQTCGLRYCVTEHSSGIMNRHTTPHFASQAAAAYGSAERVFAVSEAIAKVLRHSYSAERVTVVPNVVDTGFFRPGPRSRGPGFTFLVVASMDRNKALDLLIRAFHLAFGGTEDVRLRIIGDGPESLALRALVRELDLERQVHFDGALTHAAVRDAMQQADALALSSRSETFGVVLVEAMATGLPVVSTRSGGPDQIVTKDVGVLVPPGDVAAFADAMRHVHSRPWDGAVIRQYAIDNFGNEAVAKRLVSEYELVLRGKVG
jgi:glycosyltransferase involved in cell wall biosynthesis